MTDRQKAYALLREFKGDRYLFGAGTLAGIGLVAGRLGRRAALVRGTFPGSDGYVAAIRDSLSEAGVALVGQVQGARPNAPRQDLFRIAARLADLDADLLLSFGGGSTIDAAKAAEVLRCLGGEIDGYFGTGLVTQALAAGDRALRPHVAIQTVASSAAHLTKYSNITDAATGQKKLIVDEAIVPPYAILDYGVTHSTPPALTADGALDGVSHCLEVLYGAVGSAGYDHIEEIALTAIGLVVNNLWRVLEAPHDAPAREALCLATDLGGYAIMLGGTNGGHLTSFSLVDILSHGRACAIMNPYYTVFFAPAIERPLRRIGGVYRQARLSDADFENLRGRELGLAVAEAMFAFARQIGFPTTLSQVEGFTAQHIERALAAAKNPQLKMKLENMPVPLAAETVDEYMGPILRAAQDGDLSLIQNVPA
ncbi:MAG: iron-containing alcohol dehydrogenase [Chloroflexota bacterium]